MTDIHDVTTTDVMEAEAETLIRLYKEIHDELEFRLEHADEGPPAGLEHDGQIEEIEKLL